MAAVCRQLETESSCPLFFCSRLLNFTFFPSYFLHVFLSANFWRRADITYGLSLTKLMKICWSNSVSWVFRYLIIFKSITAAYIHFWGWRGGETNSCKRHSASKSSLCKNSQQPFVARVCYLKRAHCLAEVWEYIIKITHRHWSLTASIFWCNLSSCFSRPDICCGSAAQDENAGLSFQTEHKGHIWL